MNDVIRLKGFIEAELRNAFTNEVIERTKTPNQIVVGGRKWVLQQLASSEMNTALSIGYLAVGTGTVSPATSDSALGGESLRKAIGTFSTANLTANPPSWQAAVSFATNEANTTLSEVGLFNSNSAGTMLGRATFTTLNKSTSNTLSISYIVSN